MRQSTRLIVNTAVTYARMGLSVGFGLATTRIALSTLGEDDFGLLATLGASGALLLMLSEALTSSAQRHIAFEIGRGDHDTLRRVFNTAAAIFAAMALVIALVGAALWPLLRSIITIPPGREPAAMWTFLLTVGAFVAMVIATPWRGFLLARQSLVLIAIYDLAHTILGFIAVLVLLVLPGDALITYAWLLLGVRVVSECSVVLLSIAAHPDCRPRPWLAARSQIRRIAMFAGWTLFVQAALRLRVQGTTILVNFFYGTAATAAYGLASQVGGYQNQIGAAVWRAVRPAMATIEARGAASGVNVLTLVSSKYLMLLTLFFLIPIELEMALVLDLWLAEVPPYTRSITSLVLIWTALNWASMGHQMAIEAKGDLSRYAMLMAVFDVAVLLTQVAVLATLPKEPSGRPVIDPWILPAITIAIMAAQNVARAWYVGRALGLGLRPWLTQVILPTALVGVIGGAAALGPYLLLPPTPWRILATGAAFAIAAVPAIWLLAMRAWEREHFLRVASGGVRLVLRAAGRRGPARDRSAGDTPDA